VALEEVHRFLFKIDPEKRGLLINFFNFTIAFREDEVVFENTFDFHIHLFSLPIVALFVWLAIRPRSTAKPIRANEL